MFIGFDTWALLIGRKTPCRLNCVVSQNVLAGSMNMNQRCSVTSHTSHVFRSRARNPTTLSKTNNLRMFIWIRVTVHSSAFYGMV